MPEEISLTVNGQVHHVRVEPDTPLIYVLRNDLDLKGAKLGCGLGQCGACKVLLDGRAVHACRIPVRSVQGREVTTVEGLGTADNLHPLQRAFIDQQAVQCGFCTPGMIVTAAALLKRNPSPSDDEIRAEMAGSLCRCGTHDRILRAIRRAAGRPDPSPAYEIQVTGEGEPAQESRLLPRPLAGTPDLDAWVQVNVDGTITLYTGKVELGQDLRTAVAMIGAEELDVSLERVRVVMADTERSPDEGYTVSSMSLETSGNAIRYAAAEVRRIALAMAHEELEAPVERLTVRDGTIADPATGRSVTYWDLLAGRRLGAPVQGYGPPKGPDAYRVVGRPATRLDLLAKVTGAAHFVHDLDLPGMVHGRVVRPPGYGARLIALDEPGAAGMPAGMPGVIRIVREGSFVGVVAEREEQAVQAMQRLRASATWEPGPPLPPQETLFDDMIARPGPAALVVEGTPVDDPIPPIRVPAEAAQTVRATYYRPYHAHASLGPSAAVGQLIDGKLTVWTHGQGVYPLRVALAHVLDMPQEDIHTVHVDGAGCYGHNGADDAALDAALLARMVPGRPVSVKWTRQDEHTWEPYGPATAIRMQASLDEEGRVVDWNHDVWGYAHSSRPHAGGDTSDLLAAWHLAEPFAPSKLGPSRGNQAGVHRNADPPYTFPYLARGRPRIVKHFVPDSPLRVSALRGLGSYANVFAIESFMDELARAAGADPLAFRLRHLADTHHPGDERARAVLQAAMDKAGPRAEGLGRGIAYAQYKNRQGYVAMVVDLSVDRASGRIRLARAVVAADVGQIVHPEGLANQLAGAFIQSASWTLNEQVTYDAQGITSVDWASYPIASIQDAPRIETVLLNRPGQSYLGIGEGAQGPASAAIANAVYDAAGIRLRRIPFTPQRVRAALVSGQAGSQDA
jgi:CO/xanthine dehydrogenase Mo-binding subunit/aerobic-type carbon monoxide dehydrogenase small subunit (CoxS/CutS family)